MEKTIAARRLFTGTEWLHNAALVITGGVVKEVLANYTGPLTYADDDTFLAPAFIDFQVYGAAGSLFAQYPTVQTLHTMNEVFNKQGTALFQPTVATNSAAVVWACIKAVKAYWNAGGKGVHGLHLEGPWVNPQRRGAHLAEYITVPEVTNIQALLDEGRGVIKTITLAPEVGTGEVLKRIASYGIVLSAGHSNATYNEAMESFEKGITTVTHLYNAMSPLHHRQPGLVGAAMHHPTVMASVIPDGHHVDFAAIAIAKKAMGHRLFAITDAVTETMEGPYHHQRAGDKYECNGTLSGSAMGMHNCFYNLVNSAGITVEEALRMCSLYPATALRINDKYGKLAPGYVAQAVVLNNKEELPGLITGW